MDADELDALREEIDYLFNPEPEDFERPTRDYPHERLERLYGLDLSYLKTVAYGWEGSSIHPSSRIGRIEDWLLALIRNNDVPFRLFEAGLRLYADSILAYALKKERTGELRYYPPVILIFWSAFETFVRFSSEMMLHTVKDVPGEVANFLRETETSFRDGKIRTFQKFQPVLDRYAALLLYGYRYKVDRGSRHWQRLEKAKELRDYYTHLDVKESRSLSSTQVLDFMEAVLLGIIWPSSELKRTQLLRIYGLYWVWDTLRQKAEEFTEQPFFKERRWANERVLQFYCPFVDVDTSRFPNSEEEIARRELGRPSSSPSAGKKSGS